MKHWTTYLLRHKGKYTKLEFPTAPTADIIVVIPCYNEPNLMHTLQSLKSCTQPNANVFVAVVINSGEETNKNILAQNRLTFEEVERFADINNNPHLVFHPILCENLPKKHAGVGLARKIGMDLGIHHFYCTSNNHGIIVSLDADCEVSENFLVSIHNEFSKSSKLNATIHNFHHRVNEEREQELENKTNRNRNLENAIRQYETYMYYFKHNLKNIGFPFYYHTIGSAFAVSANAYVRVGGMGRQQGGEDFYFLQKIFEMGGVKELNNTYVYPLARFSDRVPFGTGPALEKILNEPDGIMKVYSKQSFYELKKFFDMKDGIFKKNESEIALLFDKLHPALNNFLTESDFIENINDCNDNCANLKSFVKRFFHHFNTFKIIKYLNSVHPSPFPYENLQF